MFTITQAQTVQDGFIVKLKHGEDGGRLSDQIAARLQFLPAEALDESSIELLYAYAQKFDSGEWSTVPGGSPNVGYYSLQVYGDIELGPLVTREIGGRMTSWYEGFSHGYLSVSKIGSAPRPSGFNPDMGRPRVVQAVRQVEAPAPEPEPTKTAARRRTTKA